MPRLIKFFCWGLMSKCSFYCEADNDMTLSESHTDVLGCFYQWANSKFGAQHKEPISYLKSANFEVCCLYLWYIGHWLCLNVHSIFKLVLLNIVIIFTECSNCFLQNNDNIQQDLPEKCYECSIQKPRDIENMKCNKLFLYQKMLSNYTIRKYRIQTVCGAYYKI